METFRFLGFKVYSDAKIFYKKIVVISERAKSYYFKDQVRRAAFSVILNIAEGSGKKSDADFARFLEIAICSVNEVVAGMDVFRDFGKISKTEYESLILQAEELARQLGGFIKKLRSGRVELN